MGGGSDHGGIVGGEGAAGEVNIDAAAASFGFKCGAEFAIGGDATRTYCSVLSGTSTAASRLEGCQTRPFLIRKRRAQC